jgi:hypothetical protein
MMETLETMPKFFDGNHAGIVISRQSQQFT